MGLINFLLFLLRNYLLIYFSCLFYLSILLHLFWLLYWFYWLLFDSFLCRKTTFCLFLNRLRLSWSFILKTLSLYSIKIISYDWLWIKSRDLINNCTLAIMYSGIWVHSSSNMISTMWMIPLTIKIIYFEAPFFLMF